MREISKEKDREKDMNFLLINCCLNTLHPFLNMLAVKAAYNIENHHLDDNDIEKRYRP